VLLFVFFWTIGPQDTGVAAVEKGFPADRALQLDDRIIAVDGKRGGIRKLSRQIQSHHCAGKPVDGCRATTPVTLLVERDGRRLTVQTTPVYDDDVPEGKPRTRLGFTWGPAGPHEPLPASEAFTTGADRFWFITKATLELPARLVDPEQRKEISGVVGSYEYTRQTILTDLEEVIGILAIISLSLAIVNLFPFLPLDGGHIFWAIVEKIRRKPVPFSVMERAGVVGFMLVIFIFLIGLSNDIDRLSGEGFGVR
jgi:regulator of sigma E protease